MTDGDGDRFTLDELRDCAPRLGYAYRGLVPGGGENRRHTPGWMSCWLVDVGWAEVRFEDGRSARAGVGEWLLCPPVVPRYQIFPREAEILSLAFHLPLPPDLDPHRHLPLRLGLEAGGALRIEAEAIVEILGGHVAERTIRYRAETLALADWLRLQQALSAFVAAWGEQVFRLGDARAVELDPRVREAHQVLAARPRMGPVPYDVLELRTGLGRVQLDRLFKQALGRSPKQALDRLCLERVLRRLDDPRRPIKAIAAELGFTDSSHLCRWFARQVGSSPERYRRSAVV